MRNTGIQGSGYCGRGVRRTRNPGKPIRSVSPAFTLLEVMIAVAIIAIAFTVLLGSQSQGLSLANESRFKTTASLLAQGKIAEIEAQAEAGEIGSGSGDFGEAFPDYAWDLSVTDVSFPGAEQLAERLKRIDLEITWAPDNQYRYRLRLYKFL